MQHTPLIAQHRAAGAKLVDFAGWEMPIQYSGVVDEYHAVRAKAGLFDVSHMGRISVTGSGAEAFLQRMTTNDLATLRPMQAQYSMVCNEQGGIKDDIFVYRLAKAGKFLLCVNASNRDKIVSWLTEHSRGVPGCQVSDRSAEIAQIALQGSAARAIVAALGLSQLEQLKLRESTIVRVANVECLVARTGYTGEFGYEFYVYGQVSTVWDKLFHTGKSFGLKPAGLGARDLLRLEMGYLLYGNDIAEQTTPIEAGAEWTVRFEKGEFVGRPALLIQKQAGLSRRFVGFELSEKGVPRHGFKILSASSPQSPIGEVTSGNLSPLLQKGIGLGYVSPEYADLGTDLLIDIRGKAVPAQVVKPPFYKRDSK
ncbi:MAG: glycine cleavage system protein T [Nitrospira sp. LK265]|nr:glycine cleavage system aminomethyltransferase GcvT [Nitrospira sp.]NGZ59004.1 glycine cleavage system protein T [Nitrospira sp. LK265]